MCTSPLHRGQTQHTGVGWTLCLCLCLSHSHSLSHTHYTGGSCSDGNDYILLGRVPRDQILVREAYEFYQAGSDDEHEGTWSASSASASKVFEFEHMTGQDHTFYSPQLRRYILPNYGFMDPQTGIPTGWHGLYPLQAMCCLSPPL